MSIESKGKASASNSSFPVRRLADLADKGIEHRYIEAWRRRWSAEQGNSAAERDGVMPIDSLPLLPLQQEVFSHPETFNWPGKNLLITGPTSGGKTFVAEVLMAFVRSQYRYRSQRCIYAVPLRALATEKFEVFRSLFGRQVTAVSSSDYRDDDAAILYGDKRIVVVVYEKLYLWLARARDLLQKTALLIVDELHMVGNPERGAKLEMILTLARDFQEKHPAPEDQTVSDLRIVGLAPSEEAVSQMQPWLGAVPIHCAPASRPVRLIEGWVTLRGEPGVQPFFVKQEPSIAEQPVDSGGALTRNVEEDLLAIHSAVNSLNSTQSPHLAERRLTARGGDIHTTVAWNNFVVCAVDHFVRQGKKVLVYRASKNIALRTAKLLAQRLPEHEGDWDEVERELHDLEDTHARKDLEETMARGVGFHHGDMTPQERELVERRFRGGPKSRFDLTTVVATPTLGMGINLPADIVLMADSTTFHVVDPNLRGVTSQPLSVLEYKNYAGRAGRYRWNDPNKYGVCILLAESADHARNELQPYLEDPVTEINSTLHNPQSGIEPYVLASVGWLGANNANTREQVLEVFKKSYGYDRNKNILTTVERALDRLRTGNPPAGHLINPATYGLVGSAGVAAGAAISIKTYELLRMLQTDLDELLSSPLVLLYHLSTTSEVIRLYPASIDWKNRTLITNTVWMLRQYYEKLPAIVRMHEAARQFVNEGGNPDDYTLQFLIQSAAAWGWIQGGTARELEKTGAFPEVRWGHLSDLGESIGALIETLGRMWMELSGSRNEPGMRREMMRRVRRLALQLRYGVPEGVEEIANLRVKGWHRDRLLALWRMHQWDHPVDILRFRAQDVKRKDLADNLKALQTAVQYHPRWLADPRKPWQRQVAAVQHLLYGQDDTPPAAEWPNWIESAHRLTGAALEPVLVKMLSEPSLGLQCERFDSGRNDAEVDIVVYLPDGRCVAIDVKTSSTGEVNWNDASNVSQKVGPPGVDIANRVTIASPGFGPRVSETLKRYGDGLLLLSLEAFIEACLNCIQASANREALLAFLSEGSGLYANAADINQVLPPRPGPADDLADEIFNS